MKLNRRIALGLPLAFAAAPALANSPSPELRGTGNLGLVIERATGSVLIVEYTGRSILARVDGLGDLSHASVVFSPDQRHAFVFGRDGGLSRIDMLEQRLVKRIVQGGNSIGGAISDDGQLIAVSNYEPGGVRIFDHATLEPLSDIKAGYGNGQFSKTVGLVDLPGRRFAVSLYDAGEIWLIDCSKSDAPLVTNLGMAGKLPYDGYVTADGRHYLAGLFGEDGLAHVDLWQVPPKIERVMAGYGKGQDPLPVYKMPHLEGWGDAGRTLVLPAVGHHEVLLADNERFTQTGSIAVHGQPVFCIVQPGGRYVWVNFAPPENDTVQVIDMLTQEIVHSMTPGPAVLHMEFTPKGHEVWLSVRDADVVQVYSTSTYEKLAELPTQKPSGIFFTARANRIGQ